MRITVCETASMLRYRFTWILLLLPVALTACANGPSQYAAIDNPATAAPAPADEPTVDADGRKFLNELKPPDTGVRQASLEQPLEVPQLPAADEPTPASGDLTLAQLEAMALASHPTLQQMAAVVDKTRGVYDQVGRYPNPIIGYAGQEMGSDGTLGMQGGFISQTFITGDKLKLNRDVASWNVQEFSWLYQARKQRVLNDVRLRFYEALGAQQRVAVAKQLVKVANDGVTTAKQKLKALRGTEADVLQATIDLNDIRILQNNAEVDAKAAWKRLAISVGRTDLALKDLKGELKSEGGDREFAASATKLLDESPQLQAARSRIQGARLAIERQEAQPIPNLITQLGAAHNNSSGDNVVNLQVGIPLPTFNRNQGNIVTACAEYYRALRDSQRLELQLRDTLTIAFREYEKAKYQVARYEKDILPAAKKNLDIVEKTYEGGQISFLRVLTARRTYFETALKAVESRIALRTAEVILDGYVLTGGLTEVPNFANRSLSTAGQRGQALNGQ